MGTSLPTSRFGKAIGINTPCNSPRAKPALCFSRFTASAECWSTMPITNASARIVTMVRRMRSHLACMGPPVEPAKSVEDWIDLASFIAINHPDGNESDDQACVDESFQHF